MSKSWKGSIEGIELDWHEGVFIDTEASPHSDPRLPSAVYYDAKCCLCEWAYGGGRLVPSSTGVGYGHKTPDIEGVLGWAREHRRSGAHVDAIVEFRKEKKRI